MELAILSDEISLDLEESIRLGRQMGIRKYELRCLDDYDHRVPNLPASHLDRLEELVAGGTIEITGLSPGTFKIPISDKASLDREMGSILPESCEIAKRLKAPRIITFAFMREPEGDPEEVVRLLRKAGELAAGFGLQLSVENEPGAYGDTGVNTAAIVKAVGLPNVGINWDPANAVYSGEAAFPVGYDAVLPYLQNVHIKDGIPLPPDKWENRLLGDGGVNWVGQLEALYRGKPVPQYTMETHVFPLLESTRENLRRLDILASAARQLGNLP